MKHQLFSMTIIFNKYFFQIIIILLNDSLKLFETLISMNLCTIFYLTLECFNSFAKRSNKCGPK